MPNVHVYFNQTPGSQFMAYHQGDALTPSRLNPIVVDASAHHADQALLEQVFSTLNADERPNGRFERSLSAGDVVVLEREGIRTAYACDAVGWRPVDANTLCTCSSEPHRTACPAAPAMLEPVTD